MGDSPAPSTGESTEEMMSAYTRHFPELMKINAANILPTEQAKLAASQATSPAYEKLQQELFSIYGPMYGKVSDQINTNSAQSQAQSDLNIVKGTGRDLVKEALDTQKLADPEYYETRSRVSGGLKDLISSIDLKGGLSGGEREEISRGLAQEGSRRGTLNTPSQTDVVANAMTFGGAQRARENESKGQLAAALGLGTSFLPASQSGVDVFKVATGKTSMPNAGDSKFQGVNQGIGSETFGTGQGFMNNINAMRMQENDINANRRDMLDRMNEVGHALGSLG